MGGSHRSTFEFDHLHLDRPFLPSGDADVFVVSENDGMLSWLVTLEVADGVGDIAGIKVDADVVTVPLFAAGVAAGIGTGCEPWLLEFEGGEPGTASNAGVCG